MCILQRCIVNRATIRYNNGCSDGYESFYSDEYGIHSNNFLDSNEFEIYDGNNLFQSSDFESFYSNDSHSRRRSSRKWLHNVTKEVGGAWARGRMIYGPISGWIL